MYDIKKLMPVILLAVIFVIGLPFVAAIMGSVDEGVDLTGSDYEEQYDATTDVSTSSLGIMKLIPYILAVVILIFAIGALAMKGKRRGY
jgi:ethanolamine transporter EutH